MNSYTARATLGDTYWLVEVPEIGHVTQARHLREIEVMARDLIATMLEVPADSFELGVVIELPASTKEHLRKSAELRAKAADAQTKAAAEAAAAAKDLAGRGVPMRDIGAALGISHQRVHQLVSPARSQRPAETRKWSAAAKAGAVPTKRNAARGRVVAVKGVAAGGPKAKAK